MGLPPPRRSLRAVVMGAGLQVGQRGRALASRWQQAEVHRRPGFLPAITRIIITRLGLARQIGTGTTGLRLSLRRGPGS